MNNNTEYLYETSFGIIYRIINDIEYEWYSAIDRKWEKDENPDEEIYCYHNDVISISENTANFIIKQLERLQSGNLPEPTYWLSTNKTLYKLTFNNQCLEFLYYEKQHIDGKPCWLWCQNKDEIERVFINHSDVTPITANDIGLYTNNK